MLNHFCSHRQRPLEPSPLPTNLLHRPNTVRDAAIDLFYRLVLQDHQYELYTHNWKQQHVWWLFCHLRYEHCSLLCQLLRLFSLLPIAQNTSGESLINIVTWLLLQRAVVEVSNLTSTTYACCFWSLRPSQLTIANKLFVAASHSNTFSGQHILK